uniref:Peptidase A2 domain-containing protein n=1 Tax=Strongyloides venezuelensis TaxID=75913 RepID=A0A0K0FWA4_STRVS
MSTTGASTPVVTPGGERTKEKLMPQGMIPEYNPKKESWGEYKERMEIVCEIHEIKDNSMRRNLLLTSLPPEVYRKPRTSIAPMKPVSVTYEKVVEALDKLLEPIENLLLNRLTSLSLRQNTEENVNQYIEKVKESVSKCGLDKSSAAKDMMLTLCFVNGLREGEYKKAAIQQHRSKLDSNFEETCNAVINAELIQNSEKQNIIYHVDKRRECKYRREKCKICDKVGHLAKVCKAKKKQGREKTIDNIESEEKDYTSSIEDDHIYQICEVEEEEENARIKVLINNVTVRMLLDTGACRTLINERVWNEIGKPIMRKGTNSLRTFSGEIIKVIGECSEKIKINEKEGMFNLVIVKGEGQNLLGRNVIDKLEVDLNQLYFKNKVFYINSEEFKDTVKKRFPSLFSEGLGCCNVAVAKIIMKAGVIPKKISYRFSNLNMKEKINEEIERLTRLGVWSKIETSEWISPMSVALKSNGKVSLCANFKPTNNKSIENGMYQIPISNEIFSKLVGCRIFSSVDMSDAFLQIKVDEESSKLLVVSTPLGLGKYERLSFGLSTSPIIFQEIMSNLLDKEERTGVYYDDIIVGGEIKQNMTLHYSKCLIFFNQVGSS